MCRAFGEPLSIENLHLASPKSGQVQVKVLASAVCHSDIHFFEGAWGGRLPAVWGHEAAGVVEILGEGVQGIAVGDHVVITLIKSCGECRNCLAGVSVECTGELTNHPTIGKYRNGDLLLDQLITQTCTLDEIDEAIELVKSGQGVRNVILFDQPSREGGS